MKIFLQFLAGMVVFGFLVGMVASNATTMPYVPIGKEEEAAKHIGKIKKAHAESQDPSVSRPTARCRDSIYHFGTMDPLTVGQHTFYIRNEGESLLTIRGGGSSCKCTLSDLENAVVAPGEMYPIKLTWNSGHSRKEFKQLATVVTNDPLQEEIQLVVTGDVRTVITSLPDGVDMGRLTPEVQSEEQFVLYSQVWDGMEVVEIESTNPHFEAKLSEQAFQGKIAQDDEILNATSKLVFSLKYDGQAPQGQLGGRVRIRLRPPQDWIDQNRAALATEDLAAEDLAAEDAGDVDATLSSGERKADGEPAADAVVEQIDAAKEMPHFTFPVEDDGTVIAEVPFVGRVVRRVSLYGPSVSSEGVIDLGKLQPEKSLGTTWSIVGRIRGDKLPGIVEVELTGIPGMVANASKVESGRVGSSFRIQLEVEERMEPAIYNRDQSGLLVVKTPGMPVGDEVIELPVRLVVVGDK